MLSIDEIVHKYRLFVGAYRKGLIGTFKRLSDRFVVEDYEILLSFLEQFTVFFTTPNVLTEVSNLCGQLPQREKPGFYATFEFLTAKFKEQYFPSKELLQDQEFRVLGLADAAIRFTAETPALILTDDFRLSGKLSKVSVDVLNFNHLRTYFAE